MDSAAVETIDTDYLVVGAGAAGLAFADTLIAQSDADVVLLDRRQEPGGHWVDAYPFVRLHQPSAFYGVNSHELGENRVVTTGPDSGFYERASGIEVRDYFQRVLEDHLVPSGRVRFFGGVDYLGDWGRNHAFHSFATARTATVRVRKRVVDTTYLESSVPATHVRGFSADDEAQVIAVGQLPEFVDAGHGFTILGGGKTAMDACCWLIGNGVAPDQIRWIRPRDAWVLDRAHFQPFELAATFIEGMSRSAEALAFARDVPDFVQRVEDSGMLMRLDSAVEPTMFRGAIASQGELASLRQIERVIRLGRVLHVGRDRIVMDQGECPTTPQDVHVDCTAYGLGLKPQRPTFEPGRITIQAASQTTPFAAMVAYVEAARADDVEKNRLCRPTVTPNRPHDWALMLANFLRNRAALISDSDVRAWRESSRLNMTRGLADRHADDVVQAAWARLAAHQDAALANVDRLLPHGAGAQMLTSVAPRPLTG